MANRGHRLLPLIRRALAGAAVLLCAGAPARAIPVFDKEPAVALTSATALAFTGSTGGAAYAPLRMYYLPAISTGVPHASSGTAILSATSVDGIVFTREAGIRVATTTVPSVGASSITGCAIASLSGGGYRMLYSIVSTTGTWRIHHATSADGLAWTNQSGAPVDGGATFVGSPQLVVLNSGDWRLYYTRDVNGGNDLGDRQIYTARSTDEGATWGASSIVLSTTAYETGAAKLTDGRVRLFYTQPPQGTSSATMVASALSSDALGNSFSQETGVRLSTPANVGSVSFPVPVRSTDSFRWRLYYSFYDTVSSTGDARSALTGSPAPANMLPGGALTSGAAASYSIPGEIYSGGAGQGVALRRGATTITGTGVTRTNDQTLSATLNTQNQAVGYWDLIVTNNDTVTATLANAFYIDFAPGSVMLTNNLLRPSAGIPTSVDVTTYNPGRVTVRVHSADGRALRTLFDDERPAGSFTVTWDGKDAAGNQLASGVYLIVSRGPKLADKAKVVLIR